MKKIVIGLLAVCTTFTCMCTSSTVKAIDFSKKESYYIKLCSSSSLTTSNKSVCEEFNRYLSKKNAQLKKDIKETQSDLADTKNDISSVSNELASISKKISSKENEISYIETSIKNIQNNITKKEKEMEERLYAMQTYYNSNSFIDFIFGSSSFTDFFSRLNSVNDITSYEKELVKELTSQKKQLSQQKTTLVNAKASLQSEKNSANAMRDKLLDLKIAQQNSIASAQNESKKVSAAQAKIDAALDALISNAPSGGTSGSLVPGSSAVGNAVASAALSKLGSRYWWGKQGPTYFDCSGLVYWAHRQAGVSMGRTTAAGYSRSGKGVSYSQLQAGDVITFNYGSGVAHIGIYIGGGKMVHASGKGSGTVGQYADQCVKVASIGPGTYWSKYTYNYRRLY